MEPDPRTAIAFEWDSRNIDKLAKRHIRPEDVEAVFTNRPRRFLRNKRSGTAAYLMIGTDDSVTVTDHRRVVGRRTRTGAPRRDRLADLRSDHMNPAEEETRIARIEADASNPDLWEEIGGPNVPPRTLGTSITIRLDPDLAGRLRAIARRRGIGYTSLARQMLEERINQHEGGSAPSTRFVLDVQVSPSGDVTVEQRAS